MPLPAKRAGSCGNVTEARSHRKGRARNEKSAPPRKRERALANEGGLSRFYLGVDDPGFGLRADDDAAGLFLLRHNAFELDVQESVFELGAPNLDVLGQLETPFEAAPGDALMEIMRVRAILLGIALACY